jgi:hypothetical protein
VFTFLTVRFRTDEPSASISIYDDKPRRNSSAARWLPVETDLTKQDIALNSPKSGTKWGIVYTHF